MGEDGVVHLFLLETLQPGEINVDRVMHRTKVL